MSSLIDIMLQQGQQEMTNATTTPFNNATMMLSMDGAYQLLGFQDVAAATTLSSSSWGEKTIEEIMARQRVSYRDVSTAIGYQYFFLWSVCFYPQVWYNYRRKSTAGLSHDFCVLNLMGWSFYLIYVLGMYCSPQIQAQYQERFQTDSPSDNSVRFNDVAFAAHAALLSLIYVLQILYYGNGDQRQQQQQQQPHSQQSSSQAHGTDNNNKEVSSSGSDTTAKLQQCRVSGRRRLLCIQPQTWFMVLAMGTPAAVVPCLICAGWLRSYETAWLDYVYCLSFFKIACTLTKYSKQALLNHERKSTAGWNIWYNVLECAGGLLSTVQIMLDAVYIQQDVTGITGNLAKLVLGLATLSFDAIFFVQHYLLYPSSSSNSSSSRLYNGKGLDASVASLAANNINNKSLLRHRPRVRSREEGEQHGGFLPPAVPRTVITTTRTYNHCNRRGGGSGTTTTARSSSLASSSSRAFAPAPASAASLLDDPAGAVQVPAIGGGSGFFQTLKNRDSFETVATLLSTPPVSGNTAAFSEVNIMQVV